MCLKAACVCGVNVPFVIVCEVHATCNLVLTCVFCCVAISALCACACVANMHVFLCVQQSSSAACHLLQQKSTSADLLLLPLHCTPLAPSLEQRNLSPMSSTSRFTYRSKNYPWPRGKKSIEGGIRSQSFLSNKLHPKIYTFFGCLRFSFMKI